MNGMLFAERAIFFELQPFGIILFVLHGVVISLFALRAFKRNFRSVYGSHFGKTPCKKITPLRGVCFKVYHKLFALSTDFAAGGRISFTR